MSNTGRKKKLASFNCDQKMWSQFIAHCNSKGTTATATLTQFIELYLDDDGDNLDTIGSKNLDKRLDSKIKANVEEYLVAGNNSHAKDPNKTILAICSRLDKLEPNQFAIRNSQFAIRNFFPHNSSCVVLNKDSCVCKFFFINKLICSLPVQFAIIQLRRKKRTANGRKSELRIGLTARMTQFAEAIIKIQNYLNNQQGRGKKSYYNNSSYRGQSPRIQPLTSEGLASRLGVNQETVRKERMNLHPPLFVAWCKGKDRAGLGWEFNPDTEMYHPVS